MQRVLTLLLLAFVVVAAACGSGGSGGGPTENSGLAAGFVADEPQPSPDTVSATQNSASNDVVTVRINVTDTNGIHGAAFDLNYDADQADYMGWDPGTLLEQGGTAVSYVVNEPVPGQLVISANRQGGGAGANASGTTAVILLTFQVEQVGASDVTFDAGFSFLLDDSALPAPIPGIDWFGGDLTGV